MTFARRWWVVGLTWGGIVLGVLGQHFFREIDDAWRYLWVAIGIVGLGAAGTAATIQRLRSDKQLDEAKAELHVAMVDALDPLMESLAKLVTCDSDDRSAQAADLTAQALTVASKMLGHERTRASYFEARDEEPARVVPQTSVGRAGRPRTDFTAGTPAGDFVLDLIRNDSPYYCHDAKDSPPPGWDAARKRDYRTFLTVPARAGELAAGIVTVDAPMPGDLAEEDHAFLRVLATIIAIGDLIAHPPFVYDGEMGC